MKNNSPIITEKTNVPEANNLNITKREQKLLDTAFDIIENDPKELGFVCRTMVSASLPHSKPIGNQFKRSSKNFTISIIGNEEAGGIPYGTYPRLILTWLASEVVKRQSREIILGQSLADFMKKLGLHVTGGRWGTVDRFKDQMKMLFSSHISSVYEDKKTGKWISVNINIADKSQILWDPKNPNQLDLFKSQILVSDSFYDEIINAPIPIDIRALNALKDSSLALDIYFWLTYRLSYLKSPIAISFENLHMQFGAGYNNTRHGKYEFKRKFIIQLKKVMTIYPAANVKVKPEGLFISPSKSHVPKLKKII